jgi:hypothetical protein
MRSTNIGETVGKEAPANEATIRACIRLESDLLQECIHRTLKSLLRNMQRTWVQSQRTVSEQAVRQIVVQFLNLCTGSHRNSDVFWSSLVTPACKVRFGSSAFADGEELSSKYLYFLRESAGGIGRREENYLSAIIGAVCKTAGVKLTEACLRQFKANSSRTPPESAEKTIIETSQPPSSVDAVGGSENTGGSGVDGSSSSSNCAYEVDWCSIDTPDQPPLITGEMPPLNISREKSMNTRPPAILKADISSTAMLSDENTTCEANVASSLPYGERSTIINIDCDACLGFEFVTADIVALEPVVKHMHQVYIHIDIELFAFVYELFVVHLDIC